ncbi:MAG: KpsF/GutQ family sugar-phosphate isomerase [Rikenellaceae bacterium]|nr:KpsF/GutQ family sugar-phosphate isomerase [Rikenellaceae bacterium]
MTQDNKHSILNLAKQTMNSEADALKHTASKLDGNFTEAVEAILSCKGKLIVTGMGKSGLVGRKIAATLASTGTPSYYMHPGEAFHGDLGTISKGDVILAISYSGETEEVLRIVPFITQNGNTLISMTGNPASSLAHHSHIHLDIAVESEACILHLAPTTSTTVQMAMGDALAVTLMKMRKFQAVDFEKFHPGGSLGRRLLLNVGNLMRSEELPTVSTTCNTTDMIHTMSRGRLGMVIICDDKGGVVGVVTDGDMRRAMEEHKEDFFKITALDIATRNPKTITPEAKLIEAEKMMTDNKITSLLVTNADGRLQGVIQIYDLKI